MEDGVAKIGGWILAAPLNQYVQAVHQCQVFFPHAACFSLPSTTITGTLPMSLMLWVATR